ncbi:hypothetical protein FPOAC1_009623 [Fusarium poae]|uniref:hypothetical protein n=1 Tax=Fusarium poae TaxID=36050 RepID=UPI001CEBC938|nr:hypothetical protein FPOAC1_009623 [Fusarium poae]KAG8670218.1 hypothetical protein FPOAC1_009623 [Fusarium poae]
MPRKQLSSRRVAHGKAYAPYLFSPCQLRKFPKRFRTGQCPKLIDGLGHDRLGPLAAPAKTVEALSIVAPDFGSTAP